MSSLSLDSYKAVIFDLDGIITQTMQLHQKAWKKMFDAFLQQYEGQEPFSEKDYQKFVDGKPRYDGVRSFLQSRNIDLPEGSKEGSKEEDTIYELGMRKNQYFLQELESQGAEVYDDTLAWIKQWKSEGKKLAVVSSSKNCRPVLKQAKLLHFFEAVVDGTDSQQKHLKGKPEADIFLEAAQLLSIKPKEAIVFEDAISGVQAGKKGKFGLVVGVNRANQAQQMKEAGADLVINTLSELSK